MIRYFVFLLFIQSCLITKSHSKSIIRRLPGYDGYLPFKLETGYVGIGEKEDLKLFYCFVESTRNPKEDPLIFHIPGGPGASALFAMLEEAGPLTLISDNLTLTLNPYAWTKMANIIFVDIPAGTGYSYAETKQGWTSSDTILAAHSNEFIKKFLIDHPKFLRNPLYISGYSYTGIVVPKVTLDLYEGIERGEQPPVNIQGYILGSPLTDKFMDINSRFEYAHRMALISDDIYKEAIDNCDGNYVDINLANLVCTNSLRSYEEFRMSKALSKWANTDLVRQALNIHQGKVGKWVVINQTLHYKYGKSDTICYSYDIFSSFSYHKQLTSKNCRALILSGDHDFTFPHVGTEQWITLLNLEVQTPWKPFYVDDQVGGYVTEYAQNNYSLTYASVRGAGHTVVFFKPKESMVLAQRWFSSQTYSSDS
ncbi:serine carboxypeptidase-like 2 [Helianthus annuus]|uniref:serine carboxypeptidase-like 2 n=1 Tax=Helianthus annuus TaxID=4232 RepID=UPI001652E16E|nr:serine carboxypeptidase-like 2 [Helianthus annuus]